MAFSLFKKKEDDFSDFTKELSNNTAGNNANTNPEFGEHHHDHLGLPIDGDITNTAPAQQHHDLLNQGFDSHSSPQAFHDMNEFASQKQTSFFSQPVQQQGMQQQSQQQDISARASSLEKDMQIVNAKIDAIKAVLESINHRLIHIEKIAEQSQHKEEIVRW